MGHTIGNLDIKTGMGLAIGLAIGLGLGHDSSPLSAIT
jgi:hypothetical protein